MTLLKNYQQRILGLMIDLEFKLAELYAILSEQFYAQREFWSSISAEELEHAEWLEYLYKKAGDGSLMFNEESTKTYTVEAFLSYLTGVIEKAKHRDLSLAQALSLSLDIEKSMLEKKVFEHFQSNSLDLKNVLKTLKDETERHATTIRGMWLRCKGEPVCA
ncbi:MAG TPA: hypothetical protein DCO77_08805 [Nitrospiraceae bacterium]|nr:hypothetical protein [Nitrospiraceae bacterium]